MRVRGRVGTAVVGSGANDDPGGVVELRAKEKSDSR